MANQNVQNEQIDATAEYKLETLDTRTEIRTVWFKINAPGYEWTDVYVGLSKRNGEWLSGSHSFFDLDSDLRTHALSEARSLLHKMS